VRYLVSGGVAAIAYGVPRATIDVDLVIDPTEENAAALLAALRETGPGTAHLVEPRGLLEMKITIFEDMLRVDVQTRTLGLEFGEAWERRRVAILEGVPVNLVSLPDLIATREAAGQAVNRQDLAIPRQVREDS
jgi:hypothetical protein